MENNGRWTLEQSLANTEANAQATLRASASLRRRLRLCCRAAKVGDLEELSQQLEAAESALEELNALLKQTKQGAAFDAQRYLAQGEYTQEILDTAQRMGLSIFQRGDRLYCHPALVRIAPNDQAVFINRRRERRIRPPLLVKQLKDLQHQPPSFSPDAFLTAMLQAYSQIVAQRRNETPSSAPVIPLLDIYNLFTLLPGQTKEYSKQEFVRDVYLVHRSGRETTKSGVRVSFSISRGVQGKTLTVVDEAGEERYYYGIRFTYPTPRASHHGHVG